MTDMTRVRESGPTRLPGSQAGGMAAASLCVAAALLLISGCDRQAISDPTERPAVVGTPSAAPSGVGPVGSASPGQTPSSTPAIAALPDGRSAVIITKINSQAGTVTFDLVEVLFGDAMKTYLKSHPDAVDPNYSPAYIIVNDNPRLRTLPIAPTATVRVINVDSGNNLTHPISLAALSAHLKTLGYHDVDGRSTFPYYLTVLHGQVTAFEELGVA